MKTEVETLKVFNPFSGEIEELICTLELHFLKAKLVAASITKIVSETGDDILEWQNNEKLEEIEAEYVEAFNG